MLIYFCQYARIRGIVYHIERRNLPKSEVELAGELPVEDFARAWDAAVKNAAAAMNVQGFRPGNAPERLVIEGVGEDALLRRAAEIALQRAYPKMLEEQKIEAIGQPEVAVTKLARNNPLGFKIKTAVIPGVVLPDYKSIARAIFAAAHEHIAIEDREVGEALEQLRRLYSKSVKNAAPEEKASAPQAGHNTKTDAAAYGERENLPELNDDFARAVGPFHTLDDLRKSIRENLRFKKTARVREQRRTEALDAIARASAMDIPTALIEGERDRLIENLRAQIEHAGLLWPQYLTQIKKSEDELKKEMEHEGEKRARYGLTVRALIAKERIAPSDKDVERCIAILRGQPDAKNLDTARLRDYAYSIAMNDRVFQFLEEQANHTKTEEHSL